MIARLGIGLLLVATLFTGAPKGAGATGPSGPRSGTNATRSGPKAHGAAPARAEPARTPAATPAQTPTTAPLRPAKRLLTVGEARAYMVQLINRDRAKMGLPPVELDTGAPTRAGQRHAEDMAKNGFLGHWGSDGSVPEQRHTEAGGADMVLENASCFTDEKPRRLDPNPRIDAAEVERTQAMFFNEVPPNDGHRRNILKPFHKKVGIGIAQPVSTAEEIAVPCFTQEFTDPYGTYAPIPKRMKVGDTLRVSGTIDAGAEFAGVGLARVDAPKPLSPSELNRRRSYPVPAPYQMYWPKGFKTPIPVQVNGKSFSIDLPVSDRGKAGMYELSIWAKVGGSNDFTMVGLRTFIAE
jgi:uncharacterized protein YkwD